MSQTFYAVVVSTESGDYVSRTWARLPNAIKQARTLLSVSSAGNYDAAPAITVSIVKVS